MLNPVPPPPPNNFPWLLGGGGLLLGILIGLLIPFKFMSFFDSLG